MGMVQVECKICFKKFEKSRGEYNRSTKLNRRHYCSLKCSGLDNWINLPPNKTGNIEFLKGHEYKGDEYSPYRCILRRMEKHQNERKIITVDAPYLKSIWNQQGGYCPYTGWKLDNPHNVHAWNLEKYHPARASLDRIDSSKGYLMDNVQFVAGIYNYAKNEKDHMEVLNFCKAVVEYRNL